MTLAKWDEYGERFLELRGKGVSYSRIAKEIPVSVTTLKKWGQDWLDKIQEIGRVRIATFVQEELITLEKRLELRAEQIQRMRDELATRDLSQLDDATLLRIYLRYLDAVGKEVAPLKLKVEVSNPLATYENVLFKILQVPPGTTLEDVPSLAAEFARGPAPEKEAEAGPYREKWRQLEAELSESDKVDQNLPES